MKDRTLNILKSLGPVLTQLRRMRTSLLLVIALAGSTYPAWAGTCTVDATQTNQFIRSIGASSAWSGIGSAGQALFAVDNTNGHIGLSSLRARIDPNNSFSSEVNSLATAHSVNPNILLWATEWSPPAQYKGNNNVNGSGTNGSLSGATATFTGASSGSPNAADTGYANYLVSFVQYAQSHGASLYAVSVQNEPNWNPTYEAAIWSAGQFAVFVPVLHSALQSAGLSTKIIIPEPVNPGGMNLASTAMSNSTTASEISIIATHLYGGTANPLSSYGFANVTNQEWWETEVSGNTTDMPGALQEAGWIQSCLVNASMNSFSYWWLTDLLSNNNLTIKAYVLGNYSKFIRPGYYRMGATASPTSGVSVSAFKNTNNSSPQTIVFVAINNNGSATNQTFALNGVNVTSVTPWVTDSGNNLVAKSSVAVSGNSFTYSLTASSVTSFIAVVNGTSVPTNTPTKTNTPVPPTATFTATSTFTVTRTNTPVPPTATFTSTATRTNTPVPPTATFTSTSTRTNTPVPPTATFTSTSTRTNTPVPPTATFSSTATNTSVPPTATWTGTNSPVPPTDTMTNTPVPPTVTNTPVPPTVTFTSVPPTVTSTNTAVPPTSTFTSVPPTVTSTNTPVPPTATRTNTPVPPTATFTVVSTGNLKVQLLSGVTSATTNSPHPQIQVVNTGAGALALNNVQVKYWFNCDCTGQTIQAWVDWAGLMPAGSTATGNVSLSVQATSLGGQTNAVVLSFTGNVVLQAGQKIQVQARFNKNDWSNMSQSNDWSFAANTAFTDAPHVTGYVNGGLVWGQEPAGTAATLSAASVTAFPNPSTGNGTNLSVQLSGNGTVSASGVRAQDAGSAVGVDPTASVTLKVYTLGGRLIWSQTLPGSGFGSAGTHNVYWNERDLSGAALSNGVYNVEVEVASQGQSSRTVSRVVILR